MTAGISHGAELPGRTASRGAVRRRIAPGLIAAGRIAPRARWGDR